MPDTYQYKVRDRSGNLVSGTLVADKVSFRDHIRLHGTVGSLSVDGAGAGTLVVNGLTGRVDVLTRQDDPVSSLADGDFVEARGFLARDGSSVVVTRIRTRNDDRPIVQGVVTAKDEAGSTLTILGKTIAVGSAVLRNHRVSSSVDGPTMSKAEFFAAITVGQTLVKARGADLAAFVDPTLTAEEAELEGER